MKAQPAIAIVEDVMANAPHLLKALGYGVFGVIFFGLTASAFASATLDLLVNAAAHFSTAIGQQLVTVQNDPAPAEFAEKTLAYAEAKVAYFTALRDEMPELINIASGKEPRPLQLDRFAGAFSVAGEKQEKAADEKTLVFLEGFSGNPDIEKAKAEFKRAQKIEEAFHKDFDGVDFTIYSRTTPVRRCAVPGRYFTPPTRKTLRTTPSFPGKSFTTCAEIRGGQSSPEVTNGRCLAGCWNNLTFCLWSRGIELLIDAVTLALNNQVRIFASLLADVAVRYPAAFAVTAAVT
jgi:hypothetical protein